MPSFTSKSFFHDLRGRFKSSEHARHIGQHRSARAPHDIVHMLNRFPDFSDRMQEHGGMFDSPTGLLGQIAPVSLERLVLLLRVLVGHALTPADLGL